MGIVKARQAEILPDLAPGITGSVSASGRQTIDEDFGTIRDRPEIVGIRQHAPLEIGNRNVHARGVRKKTQAGLRVGHDRDTGHSPPFPESFVVAEEECLVLLQRTSQSSSELIPFELTLGVLE